MKSFFSFPNPVNDAAARTVALGVLAMALLAFFATTPWLLIPLTYGFLARVAAGPKISPLGQFAVRIVGPRIAPWQKSVAGPPKRFAQGIGALMTTATVIVWLSAGWPAAHWILLPLMAAASIEGFLGYCIGCKIFSLLIRTRWIPEAVCRECGDLSLRRPAPNDAQVTIR